MVLKFERSVFLVDCWVEKWFDTGIVDIESSFVIRDEFVARDFEAILDTIERRQGNDVEV